MTFADMNLSLEPVLPTLGLPVLVAAAFLLAALTVWTYLGVRAATWRRIALVLLLRLSALLLAFSMMMRPSLAITQLEGVELTKLLVVFDASVSMNVAEIDGKPTRWEQANNLWAARAVQRRLEQLRDEQKIEVVKFLGAEGLRADDANAVADGKRTDIGAWLHQLMQKHGHEKHLRGIVLVSDGADNGTKFSAQEKARAWRGLAPIHAFGVGDPANPKFRKDIGLTSLRLKPEPPELIFVRSNLTVEATAQAPGFDKTEVVVTIEIESVKDKKTAKIAEKKLTIRQEKDQPIVVPCTAPEEPGEYKVTLKIVPHPEEANKDNNEISTFIQVSKEKINVLWVDRPRVYEAIHAIRLALAPEKQFDVFYIDKDGKGDPFKDYKFDQRHYDVIIIGDISAARFARGDDRIFDQINEMVVKKKTGLLMLGGSETFVKGGWDKQKAILSLLPVKLDLAADKAEFNDVEVKVDPTKEGLDFPFLQLDPDPKKNKEIWATKFEPLAGLAPLGNLANGSEPLLRGTNGQLVMAARGIGGRVVVFAGDSTGTSWLTPESAVAYKQFWKQLAFWLAQQQDQSNQLWVNLDRRRLDANAAEALGFEFGLRGKGRKELTNATFTAEIVGPGGQKIPVSFARKDQHQQGSFQGAKEPGEHQLIVTAKAKDDGADIDVKTVARFLVAFDDIEMLRPLAEHETLSKIAASAEGRFSVLEEAVLLQYLDELKGQVNREARHKTTHWPDWKRLPRSEAARDQLAGLWNSFALVSFAFFVALLGSEWLLRRLWGLV